MKPVLTYINNYEVVLKGKPVAPGIAVGQALVLKKIDLNAIRQNRRPIENVLTEKVRLENACQVSKEQVSTSLEDVRKYGRPNIVAIFSAYLKLLEDPGFLNTINLLIDSQKLECECIIADRIIDIKSRQSDSIPDFNRKLYDTLHDLYLRLLYNLLPMNADRIARIRNAKSPVIAIAEKLTPVEVATLPMEKLLAVIIEEVTNTSHASILARTLSVPVVVNIPGIGSLLDETCEIIVDGYRGHVVINPDKRTIDEYLKFGKKINARKTSKPQTSTELFVRTSDGVELKLAANAGSLKEVEEAGLLGVTEIGLLRSEIFYLARQKWPSIKEESDFYSTIFTNKITKVTIRLLDIGADKIPTYMATAKEENPELGLRGIRYLLYYPDLLRKQIRSILHCLKPGATRILLPFVSIMEDLDEGLSIISGILSEEGYQRESVEIGIIVEIPSVALSIEDFLPKIDFVNLGTNDLVQYIFAADREQNNLSKYSRFTHPVNLRMIRAIVNAADRHGKELIACGAMASHPSGLCLLIALGVRNFSLQIDTLLEIRNVVTRLNSNDVERLIENLDDCIYAAEIEKKVKSILGR